MTVMTVLPMKTLYIYQFLTYAHEGSFVLYGMCHN